MVLTSILGQTSGVGCGSDEMGDDDDVQVRTHAQGAEDVSIGGGVFITLQKICPLQSPGGQISPG